MDPRDYLRLQLRLEGKDIIHEDLLRQAEVVPDEALPLMIMVQFADGEIFAGYDENLYSELREELTKRVQNVMFPRIDLLFDFLKTQNISFDVGRYKTYLFPEDIVNSINDGVTCIPKQNVLIQAFGFGDFAEQVYVIERDGKIASACVSVRENGQCGEAWVYTAPEYRRQGLAQKVVSAWAGNLISANKIPFYSHAFENTASANLAKRLELQSIFEELSISYMNV